MSKIFDKPIRMCVTCRERKEQDNLYRLQCLEGTLSTFSSKGRSFYICENCISQEKKVIKSIMRQCKGGNITNYTNKLKEIIADDRKS